MFRDRKRITAFRAVRIHRGHYPDSVPILRFFTSFPSRAYPRMACQPDIKYPVKSPACNLPGSPGITLFAHAFSRRQIHGSECYPSVNSTRLPFAALTICSNAPEHGPGIAPAGIFFFPNYYLIYIRNKELSRRNTGGVDMPGATLSRQPLERPEGILMPDHSSSSESTDSALRPAGWPVLWAMWMHVMSPPKSSTAPTAPMAAAPVNSATVPSAAVRRK